MIAVTVKGSKTINVRAYVVLLSIVNKEIDKRELANLYDSYKNIRNQVELGNFVWFVPNVFVENLIVSFNIVKSKNIAFLAVGNEY